MENIWYKDIDSFVANYMIFFPSNEMTFSQQLNALFRMTVYFSLILFVIKRDINVFFIPIFTAVFTIVMYNVDLKNRKDERHIIEKMGLRKDTQGWCQKPTKDNPFMNVLISDYKDNPTRARACRLEGKTKEDIKKNFGRNLYRNIDDIFHKNASDRQFYTTPSTTIPNDSIGYAKWLYGKERSCKEGNATECYRNTYRAMHV
jgi:hypothetical protein